ncbi:MULTISPECIES: ArsR/SmtB family transcription factor [unclassified Phyllobacterium]|uniref:ArsR/SmtB family transcription factor n=1 Tax=unclassified Phyllobacterium TaxID=2638441 RepID=UPI003012C0E3
MDIDTTFRALSHSTRRQLLDRLFERNGQTLSELCDDLGMTRQAVTQHLSILEESNLVVSQMSGREKLHFLNPVPIHHIFSRWIGKYENARLNALALLKDDLERENDDSSK